MLGVITHLEPLKLIKRNCKDIERKPLIVSILLFYCLRFFEYDYETNYDITRFTACPIEILHLNLTGDLIGNLYI
jgi:hypothetical protein